VLTRQAIPASRLYRVYTPVSAVLTRQAIPASTARRSALSRQCSADAAGGTSCLSHAMRPRRAAAPRLRQGFLSFLGAALEA
jgi:hypothetical protein